MAWARRLRDIFSIDHRSLGAFRIGLALTFLHDLFLRLPDLEAHYADTGMFPRREALEFGEPFRFSFHLMTGSAWGEFFLFFLHGLVLVALLLGWRTSIMKFLSWVFLLSLQNRNPAILGGGDILLRLLSFWALFLPLEKTFSLDQRHRPSSKTSENPLYFSMATLGALLQVAMVYWFTVALKNHAEWREEGTAVYFALNIDQLTTPLGRYLLNFPKLMKAATFGTIYFETTAPLLAFFPWFHGPIRLLVALAFLFFHCVLLALSMNLGIFPYACGVSWLLFLPPLFWDSLGRGKDWFWPGIRRHFSLLREKLKGRIHFPRFPSRGLWWGQQFLLLGFLLLILVWNLREGGEERWKNKIPDGLNHLTYFLGLDQNWSLFAPHPYKDDGWYVIPGVLKNGTTVEILQEKIGPISWEKPDSVYGTFPNRRWAKYFRNIWYQPYEKLRGPLSQFLCHRWNRSKGKNHEMEKLEFLEIYYMRETTVTKGPFSVDKILLWNHYCPP